MDNPLSVNHDTNFKIKNWVGRANKEMLEQAKQRLIQAHPDEFVQHLMDVLYEGSSQKHTGHNQV